MSDVASYESDRHIDWKCAILDNRYIMIKQIGHGSYCSVWICYDVHEMKYYAMKINNRDDYKVAMKETNTYNVIKAYKSPYLMTLIRSFDHNDDGKHRCFVMELMACSLYDIIKRNTSGIKFEYVMRCTHQVLKGLSDIHRHNVIHGDVKPENILLSGTNTKHKELFKKLELGKIVKSKIRNKNAFNDGGVQNKIIKELEKKMSKDKEISEYDSDDSIGTDSEIGVIEKLSVSTCDSDEYDYYDDSESEYMSVVSDNGCDIDTLFAQLQIKLTDMGNTILTGQKKKCSIQTCYYRAPEVLLGLNYDTATDMWAVGCTIYELLTGKILFDAEDYEGNTIRHHLFLIIKKLGMIPEELIAKSPNKDIFFTTDMRRIKGYKSIDLTEPILKDLQLFVINNNLDVEMGNAFISLMLGLLCYDQKKRLKAKDALDNQLFKKFV
jgi:serine/threonine-protein kinase SRPK3